MRIGYAVMSAIVQQKSTFLFFVIFVYIRVFIMSNETYIKNSNGFNYIKERPISVRTEEGVWYAYATWNEFMKEYPKRTDCLPNIIQYKGHNVSHLFYCRREIKIDRVGNLKGLVEEIDHTEGEG